jgi:hypothetical protein
MKLLESRILWGVVLVLAGVLFLIDNLGILRLGDLFWVVIFLASGVFFISIFVQNRANWWALIPGFTLLSVGLLVFLNWIAPSLGDLWGGSIVLGGIGLSFFFIYLVERENWWALIPGGVLLTLALVAGLDGLYPGIPTAGIFFLGLGLTFALVALLPTSQGDMRWAWIPGGILLLVGTIFLIAWENMLAYLWPAGLILLGGFLILRAFRNR